MIELRVFMLGAIESVPGNVYIGLITVFCVGAVLLFWCKKWQEVLRDSAVILLVEWIVLVLGTTVIFRESSEEYQINLIPLISYFDYGENSYFMEKTALNILNVVLFIPIGVLLGCGFRRMTWKHAVMYGAAISMSIEVLQLVLRRGLCEVDDVIHNVVGCMIGYGVYRLASKIIQYV